MVKLICQITYMSWPSAPYIWHSINLSPCYNTNYRNIDGNGTEDVNIVTEDALG